MSWKEGERGQDERMSAEAGPRFICRGESRCLFFYSFLFKTPNSVCILQRLREKVAGIRPCRSKERQKTRVREETDRLEKREGIGEGRLCCPVFLLCELPLYSHVPGVQKVAKNTGSRQPKRERKW